ncbi:GNAT family N-acetyltransferase [Epibacterium ulvae]|uniref:GNAT family N-acetyltransferase n=1 Tax=Epibacterium ulvae TaxID=1156985 RepID=UPI001BFCA97C|nr:GNAT family N-acetyltransferase [Epibacterium ulvae]MBT8153218.1 GNAT family N-acetyltransferase [Epibacterium ulvae]
MTVSIEVVADPSPCLALRMEVFVHEQGVPVEDELDTLDDHAVHILARDGSTPIGTARVVIQGDTAKIGRVCIVKSARGTGLGKELMQFALDLVTGKSDVKRAKLGAQTYAIGFYEGLGFAPFGPIYDDGGIPHRDMVKELK